MSAARAGQHQAGGALAAGGLGASPQPNSHGCPLPSPPSSLTSQAGLGAPTCAAMGSPAAGGQRERDDSCGKAHLIKAPPSLATGDGRLSRSSGRGGICVTASKQGTWRRQRDDGTTLGHAVALQHLLHDNEQIGVRQKESAAASATRRGPRQMRRKPQQSLSLLVGRRQRNCLATLPQPGGTATPGSSARLVTATHALRSPWRQSRRAGSRRPRR